MENYGYYNWETELYHHGTKGQKWGRRLYQNKDGSLTALGKVRYGTNKKFKTEVDRQNALKKARETKASKKEHAEAKRKAIESGSAAEVLKFKGELTPQEMQYISTRLQWEQNMQNITAREVAAGKSKTDQFFDGVGKATKYAEISLKAYNTIANVVNAFNGEKVMPKVDTDITKGNKQDIKNRKKEKAKAKEAAEKRAKQEAEGPAKREERAKKKAEKEQQAKEQQKQTESKNAKEEKKVYTGTVEGEGRSEYRKKEGPIIDGEWTDIPNYDTPISNVPARVYTAGESYVAGLLEDKSRR